MGGFTAQSDPDRCRADVCVSKYEVDDISRHIVFAEVGKTRRREFSMNHPESEVQEYTEIRIYV